MLELTPKELKLTNNSISLLPETLVNLTNLSKIDVSENVFENNQYYETDVPKLFAFLSSLAKPERGVKDLVTWKDWTDFLVEKSNAKIAYVAIYSADGVHLCNASEKGASKIHTECRIPRDKEGQVFAHLPVKNASALTTKGLHIFDTKYMVTLDTRVQNDHMILDNKFVFVKLKTIGLVVYLNAGWYALSPVFKYIEYLQEIGT